MRRLALLSLALAAACAAPPASAPRSAIVATAKAEAAPHSRRFTIEDNLRTERIGGAAVLGDLFVWEQAPPYDEIGWYGVGYNGTWDAGAWLYAAKADGGKPRLLFEPAPGALYWIASTSPDQRYLLYYGGDREGFFLGVYDRISGRHRDVRAAPAVGSNGDLAATWLSDGRVAVATLAEGFDPVAGTRPAVGRRRYGQQQRAWAGEVSATVSVSTGAPAPAERLVLLDAATGKTTPLAAGSFFFDQSRLPAMSASRDGRYLAVVGVGLRGIDRTIDGADPAAGPQLAVLDLATGAARVVSAGMSMDSLDPGSLEWSASGELAFFAWPAGGSKTGGVFHAVSMATGAVRDFPHTGLELASVHERGGFQAPFRGLWVGDRLAVFGRDYGGAAPRFVDQDVWQGARADGKDPPAPQWRLVDDAGRVEPLSAGLSAVSGFPLSADGRSLTVIADGGVWRLEPGRAPARLAAGLGTVSELPLARFLPRGRDPSPRAIAVLAGDAGPGYALLDLEAGSARAVAGPAGATLLAGDPAGGRLLLRRTTPEGTSILAASADGGAVEIGAINRYMADVIGTEWRPFEYEASVDGKKVSLTGCVLYPPGYDPDTAYPVIVDAYPGVAAQCSRTDSYWEGLGIRPAALSHHAMAAEGYIVLTPALPADLLRTEAGPIARLPALTVAAVDALGKQARIDQSRVNLMGLSYGGVTALWIATQTNRFHKVAALDSFSDLYFLYFALADQNSLMEESWPIGPKTALAQPGWPFYMGGKPHDAPLAYIENSPIHHAADVTAPVLLIASDGDGTIDQFDAMFTALKAAGKEARIVRYWGEGHGPSSPGNIRDMHREIMDWFAD